ncbi:MFS transporter, partial [Acinetobacter baumannii]
WIKDQTGDFTGGLYFVAGLLIISTLLTLVLSFSQKVKVNAAKATQ